MPQQPKESFIRDTSSDNDNESDDEFVEYESLLAHKILEKKSQPLSSSSSLSPFEMAHNQRDHEPRYTKRTQWNLDRTFLFLKIVITSLVLVALLKGVIFRPRSNVDDSSVITYNSLHLKDIKFWCLNGSNNKCLCANPLLPKDRVEHKTWSTAHSSNILQAREVAALMKTNDRVLDVVILGDSITEGWTGTSLGIEKRSKKDNYPVFRSYFQSKDSERFGLAMGISGDKSPHLLWRMQNGEIILPELQPRVYWVLIGTNDFTYVHPYCSEEVVYMGIIRVIEELKHMILTNSTTSSPRPKIVIQALLPRADNDYDSMSTGNLYPPVSSKVKTNRYKAIVSINNRLHRYSLQPEHQDFVYFVNLNFLFIAKRDNADHTVIDENVAYSDYYIPKGLMDDYLHPTTLGYKLLAQGIIKELDRIIQ